jgi:O-antigen ligase
VIGAFRQQLHPDRGVAIAQGLILLNLIAMTRAFALVNVIELILWLLFLVNKTLRRRFVESVKDPRIGLVMVFWAWIALSMLWSPAPWPERFDDWLSWRKLLLFPMAFSVFREDSAKRLVWWVLIGVAAGYMVMSWLGVFGWVTLDRPPEHLLENYATQGVVFSAATLVSMLVVSDNQFSKLIRLVCLLLSVGFVTSILFASSGRSGYLFLAIVAMGLGYWNFPKWRWVGAASCLLVVALALISSDKARQRIMLGFDEIQTAYTSTEEMSSLGMRVIMWNNTITMISNSPLLGTGAGGYPIAYGDLVTNKSGRQGVVSDDPHQQYLHIAAEYGIVALLVFCVFLAVSLLNGPQNVLVFSGLTVLVGTMVNGFANGHFSAFVEGRLLWIILGAMLASSQFRVRSEESHHGA